MKEEGQYIDSKIKEFEQLNIKSQMQVPKDYFDGVQKNVHQRIHTPERRKNSLYWLFGSAVAGMAILFSLSLFETNTTNENLGIENSLVFEYYEENPDEISLSDIALISDKIALNAVSNEIVKETEQTITMESLSQDEILDYLLEEETLFDLDYL